MTGGQPEALRGERADDEDCRDEFRCSGEPEGMAVSCGETAERTAATMAGGEAEALPANV